MKNSTKTGLRLALLVACCWLPWQNIRAENPPSPPPNWSLNASDFQFNMSITARIFRGGAFDNSAANLVGVFVGPELRGFAAPVISGGNAYFFITVFSNAYVGEALTFQVFVAAEDQLSGVPETAVFRHNGAVGNFAAPLILHPDCDDDGDGYCPPLDCDDANAAVFPGAAETPGDEFDQNCDASETCFTDYDNDGFYLPALLTSSDTDCSDSGEGKLTETAGDCNDLNALINAGAAELPADGTDQNCDGAETCFQDADNDGHRPNATAVVASSDLDCADAFEAIASDPTTDCNDANAAQNPAAAEICGNNVDENCNGPADDPCPNAVCSPFNHVGNPGFETGTTTGWTATSLTIVATPVHSGLKAAKICSATGKGAQKRLALPGEAFTVRLWASVLGTASTGKVALQFLNASSVVISEVFQTVPANSPYTQYSLTGTAPAGTKWAQIFFSKPSGTTASCLFVDDACLENACNPLPPDWTGQDIGTPAIAGASCIKDTFWTVHSGGTSIGAAGNDQFHFVWKPLTGNGYVKARLLRTSYLTAGTVSAGIMLRDGLTAGAPYLAMLQVPGGGVKRHLRTTAGAAATIVSGTGNPPIWVKITRVGSTFKYYTSTNGTLWMLRQTSTATLPNTLYVGLAVSTQATTPFNSSLFAHLSAGAGTGLTPDGTEDREIWPPENPGVFPKSNFDFSLSPNPASGFVRLIFEEKIPENGSVELLDPSGRLLRRLPLETLLLDDNRLSFKGLAAGIYALSVRDESGRRVTKRLVVFAE